jgi:hypothetical protein
MGWGSRSSSNRKSLKGASDARIFELLGRVYLTFGATFYTVINFISRVNRTRDKDRAMSIHHVLQCQSIADLG